MAFDLGELKKIKSLDVNLLFGYCREARKQLFPSNEPYYDIPSLVIYACLAFYHIKYNWDSKCIGNNCYVKGDLVLKKGSISGNSTFVLKQTISNGIYQFKFKIINYDYAYMSYYDIGFGIISSKYYEGAKDILANDAFGEHDTGYVYYGSKWEKEHFNQSTDYGIKCKLNDIVTMIVDLEKNQLSYKVNEQNLGIAFDEIPDTEYRVALYLYEKSSKVQLIQ